MTGISDPAPTLRLASRMLRHEGRMALALMAGGAAWWLAAPLPDPTRTLVAFDAGCFAYLASFLVLASLATPEVLQQMARRQGPSRWLVFATAAIIPLASMAAVATLLDTPNHWPRWLTNLHQGLSLLAVVEAWMLMHLFFGLFYMGMYQHASDADLGGPDGQRYRPLKFPHHEAPDYLDFMYYSYTIGMCFQAADIAPSTRAIRRLTLFHAIVSFFFVAGIIAVVANIISNLV